MNISNVAIDKLAEICHCLYSYGVAAHGIGASLELCCLPIAIHPPISYGPAIYWCISGQKWLGHYTVDKSTMKAGTNKRNG